MILGADTIPQKWLSGHHRLVLPWMHRGPASRTHLRRARKTLLTPPLTNCPAKTTPLESREPRAVARGSGARYLSGR